MSAPRVIQTTDAADLVPEVRRAVEAAVEPGDRIAVPTGRTPGPLYREVREDPAGRSLWGALRYLQLDEYIDPPPGTVRFAETLAAELLDPLAIPADDRGAILDPGDPEEGPRLDRILREEGPLAVCLLGLGGNGHIAFNEPGDRTPGFHVVTLSPETVAANLATGTTEPVRALTIGIDQILASRRVLLWVPQPEKQNLLDRVISGPIDPELPATALQAHPDWIVFRTA